MTTSPMCSSGTGPVELVGPVDAVDDDVRSQSADVAAERGDGAVGGDQQRKDIETFGAVVASEHRVVPRSSTHTFEHVRRRPWPTIDEWFAVGSERGVEADQLVMTS